MSWVAVSCHRCGGVMRVESSLLARQVTCTQCHATMPVPPGIEPASGEVLPPSAAPPDASSRHELSLPAPPGSGEPPVAGQTAAHEIPLGCPQCGCTFYVDRRSGGQCVVCPQCEGQVSVPLSPSPEPPIPPVSIDRSQPTAPPTAPHDTFPRLDGHAPDDIPNLGDIPKLTEQAVAVTSPASRAGESSPEAKATAHQQDTETEASQSAASLSRGAVLPPRSPDESRGQIVVPTEDGERITLHEPVKRIQWGTENRELRQIDPKERSRRRYRRNVIMWCLGASLLILTALILLRIS